MAVDKDLFVYDLAVVAIMKNEAPYVKEWLDYHLAAGVDHFYIYDNESPDNLKEVLQPYIDTGIVTYKFYPGISQKIEAYTEAFKNYRFFCRYMAFIDADEFIFPQSNKSIVEVTDEFLDNRKDVDELGINWMMYGSNFQENADYSKGVLERFTRRSDKVHETIKIIANPRKIKYFNSPQVTADFNGSAHTLFDHFSKGEHAISDKILINHYKFKSREEYKVKSKNSSIDAVFGNKSYYSTHKFTHAENNRVFDDSILAYRDTRMAMENSTIKNIDYEKLSAALIKNITPIIGDNLDSKNFEGKMETFLTCRALASFLKGNVLDNARGEFAEKLSLQAIFNASLTDLSFDEAGLLLSELPNLLRFDYPVVKDIIQSCMEIIIQIKNMIESQITDNTKFDQWKIVNDYDDLLILLQGFTNALDSLKSPK